MKKITILFWIAASLTARAQNVGIGISAPAEKFHIAGQQTPYALKGSAVRAR